MSLSVCKQMKIDKLILKNDVMLSKQCTITITFILVNDVVVFVLIEHHRHHHRFFWNNFNILIASFFVKKTHNETRDLFKELNTLHWRYTNIEWNELIFSIFFVSIYLKTLPLSLSHFMYRTPNLLIHKNQLHCRNTTLTLLILSGAII